MHHRKRHVAHWLRRIVLLCASLFLIIAGIGLIWFAHLQLPDFKSFDSRKVVESTKIYDRTGKVVLYDVHNQIRRTVVPFSAISQNIKNATLAIEDDSFYSHAGVRPLSILRSAVVDITSGSAKQGGSTITQQVVKNTLLTGDKTITRKIKEIVLALKMEQVMSKDDIFALYLNEVPYGGTIYGAEEASEGFFGVHASDVDLAQAAYLASLPQAPTYYSPSGNNRAALDARKNLVLDRMLALGDITKADHNAAQKEKVTFLPVSDGAIKAPHFVMYVKQQLEAKYGKDLVENGGLRVTTTLDWNMQQMAEQVVRDRSPEILQKFSAHSIGTVGVDPTTGQVLLMVGSPDYFDTAHEGNFNTTIAHRQPGSSFKPFVYATAFNKGYTPDTAVFNLRTQFSTACTWDDQPIGSAKPSDCYYPENYDKNYDGPMSFREALAQSVNVVAIKVLYLAGITDSITTATNMGIQGLSDAAHYGLTLVLGGGEVSLLDLVESYGGFANDGVRNPETTILRVEDSRGNLIDEWQPNPSRVLPENTAREINDILSDNAARTPAFGANSALYIPSRPVAVKTGTTNDYRDVWITGYTPNFVLGFWAGNNDNTPLDKKIAGFIIAPIWNDLINKILPTLPVERFMPPDPVPQNIKPVLHGIWQGNTEYVVDKTTGLLATDATPDSQKVHKVVTDVHDILQWVNKSDPLGPPPANPANDPQYSLWEIPTERWVADRGILPQSNAVIPTSYDNIHGNNFAPGVTITSPSPDSTYTKDGVVRIAFTAQSKYPIAQATFFLGDSYIGIAESAPFTFNFTPSAVNPDIAPGIYPLKVIAYDSVQNRGEATISITIK